MRDRKVIILRSIALSRGDANLGRVAIARSSVRPSVAAICHQLENEEARSLGPERSIVRNATLAAAVVAVAVLR